MAQRQRDGGDDRHQQQHRRDLDRVRVARVQRDAEFGGVAVAGGQRRRAARDVHAQAPLHDHADDLGNDHEGDHGAEPGVAREAAPQFLDPDVEHHDHEQEQHHDRADVDQHQCDGQELGFDQQPQHRAGEEAQHQAERRVHGVARRDHAEARGHQDGGEGVKQYRYQHGPSALPCAAPLSVARVCRLVGADHGFIALAHGQQLVLGHDVLAAMFHVILVDARLHDGIHRAGFLAEPAVDALEEVDVVARRAARAVARPPRSRS